MKRTELGRKTPLTAKTTLARRTPLEGGTGLARTRGLERKPTVPKRKSPRDTGPSKAVRALVLERDGYACVCCGVSVIGRPYSLQHRQRRSQSGGNSPSNLIVVLGRGGELCHGRIDNREDPADEEKGYTVRSWGDPAAIPVVYARTDGPGFTAWLADDGSLLLDVPEVAA